MENLIGSEVPLSSPIIILFVQICIIFVPVVLPCGSKPAGEAPVYLVSSALAKTLALLFDTSHITSLNIRFLPGKYISSLAGLPVLRIKGDIQREYSALCLAHERLWIWATEKVRCISWLQLAQDHNSSWPHLAHRSTSNSLPWLYPDTSARCPCWQRSKLHVQPQWEPGFPVRALSSPVEVPCKQK